MQQVVLLSSASVLREHADVDPIAQRHLAVERALDDAGLPRTFVRPGAFATNALRWTSIRTDRVLRTAFPEARTSMVHERDIAEVAAAALLDEAHLGKAYPLLGPGATTAREQVADIAAAIGEPVAVEVIDVEAYREQQRQQLPPSMVDALIALQGSIPSPSSDVAVDSVQAVLGRPALPFSVWARDHADDFR